MAGQDLTRLIVSLEAKISGFDRAMNKALGIANQRSRAIESRFAQMNAKIGSSIGVAARGWAGAFAAAFGTRELVALSDAATQIDNSLKVAGLSGAELERVYAKLRDTAIANAAPIEALVELYSRAALVQNELGITSEQLEGFTNNVAVALRVSGKSAAESSGALLQLSQALGSGVVRAEEFNSILEGAPNILQAAAAGIKEAGGSVSKLRSIMLDGELSSRAFFDGIAAGAPVLEAKLAGSTITVGLAIGNFRTALIDAAREFNNATGASERFAGGINSAAKAITDFDVAGFIAKISSAHGALESFLNDLGNAQIFKDLSEAAGTSGAVLDVNADAAKREAESLEREVVLLQETIAKNTELGFDNTEALARLAEVRAAMAALTATSATPAYQPGTPGDPNALAQRQTLGQAKAVDPISIKDPQYKVTATGTKGTKTRQNDLQREIEQISERTALLQAETAAQATLNPLLEDYDYTLTKASATQELLNAAKEAGIKITPELKAQIESLAEGYAQATVAANQLAESQDRTRAAAEDMRALGKDVLGGFISDLRNGTSAAEALQNALSKVLDKLLEIALNSIFDSGGGGTTFSSLFSGIGALFGFADGGIAAHGKPIKKFARGGVSKSAAIFGEAGAEAAVPLPDGRQIPVDLRVPQVGASSSKQQAMHVTVGVSADNNGNLKPFVESVSRQEARGAVTQGLAGYDKAKQRQQLTSG